MATFIANYERKCKEEILKENRRHNAKLKRIKKEYSKDFFLRALAMIKNDLNK